MRCDNCRCIVPDTCDTCMYCGHVFRVGATKTVPVNEYSGKVTYYDAFPTTDVNAYAQSYDQHCNYYNPNFYNENCSNYDDYVTMPSYEGYYGCRYDRNEFCGYSQNTYHRYNQVNYGCCNGYINNNDMKTNNTLLYLVAVDVLFLLTIFMLLLLVTI